MTTIQTLSNGEVLFRQGDASRGFFRVHHGRVRLLRHTADGAMVTLYVASAGECFAEAALFSTHYHCDAIADEPADVELLPKADWLLRLETCPVDIKELLEVLARDVQRLRARLVARQTRSAEERILLVLHAEADSNGAFMLRGTVKSWASELGLTHECVYRTLAALVKQGVIQRAGRAIYIKARMPAGVAPADSRTVG